MGNDHDRGSGFLADASETRAHGSPPLAADPIATAALFFLIDATSPGASTVRMLSDGASKVSAVGLDVGFASEAAFSRSFKKIAGITPAEWRKQSGGSG